jgi:peptidoglycan hydrolase-like protein with peptidoglycan-binding domain
MWLGREPQENPVKNSATRGRTSGTLVALRRLIIGAVIAALAAVGATFAATGTAFADTGSSLPGCPQLDEGDVDPCVARLQMMLNKVRPEYSLPGTTTFGEKTRIALLDFQGRNLLGADGRFGTTTAYELQRQYDAAQRGAVGSPQPKPIEPTAPASPASDTNKGSSFPDCPQLDAGDTGPCVAKLQQMLNKVHPEYRLPGTQTYGQKTRDAVADFQERNHITGGNGQFGPGTAGELQRQADRMSRAENAGNEEPPAKKGGVQAQGAPAQTQPCHDKDSVINQYTGECQSPEAGTNDGGSGLGETAKVAAKCTWNAAEGTTVAKKAGKIILKSKKLPKKGDVLDLADSVIKTGAKKAIMPAYIVGCTVLDPTNK